MTSHLIISEVTNAIENIETNESLHAYLFGSARRAESTWSDIDILIVCKLDEDGQLARNKLHSLCLQYPIHLLIMTFEEQTEFDFIRSEDCQLIATSNSRS